MNPKTILAANLLRLMQYAADHQTGEPSSQSEAQGAGVHPDKPKPKPKPASARSR